MESVHGVDVSWLYSNKDHTARQQTPSMHHSSTTETDSKITHNGHGHHEHEPAGPKPIPAHRPGFSRSSSTEKMVTLNGALPKSGSPSPSSSRRNSWLSSFSSKFSSPGAHTPQHTPPATTPAQTSTPPIPESPVPTGPSSPKNAILQHAAKTAGDVPYTPAPPKVGQPSFLASALRRLSNSGGQLSTGVKATQHGLCERKVLNVDRNRERCHISELDQSKLRRVAFCVDVEIASGPRYKDEDDAGDEKKKERREKKRMVEKGEGNALKNPEAFVNDADCAVKVTEKATVELPVNDSTKEPAAETTTEMKDDGLAGDKDTTKKKEKKKRSEEERKARKEKKRKLAEANGTVPVELIRNQSDSSLSGGASGTGTPRTQASPTTDPVRIYRRCCQLRETPILKKITEQLAVSTTAIGGHPGVVAKLDLTGYWLQLPDLITLGDYLAVVPVKELIMENCGLTDEGVRVVLAGLLAAKSPDWERKKLKKTKDGQVPQGGFVERIVFKDNSRIGREGWRYICTFIAMCRSLKSMDLSKVPFPQAHTQAASPAAPSAGHLARTSSTLSNTEVACLLSKALGERLAGREFELLNMAECGLTTEQLGGLIDGVIKSGLRRLGIAGNKITPEGMQHVARYIRNGKCEGLDLGGNDLSEQLGVIADALDEDNPLFALSLAHCSLTPDSLWTLFPALAKLKNFRFIDLSQNHELFDSKPSALSLLRRYLPKLLALKRIHLTDVSMTPEQAIALAEILPESPNLAHVNIMENPLIAALADAKGEADQEEACALYASLMAAVRVSQTIICIDIEVPTPDSSEVVKALAKQVVAYCLWNMESGPVAEISEDVAAVTAASEPHGGEKEVAVPDVLLHLVGHVEGFHENHDDDEPAPDEDYVIGGTGVVKALGICLRNKGNDSRRPLSSDRTLSTDTPERGSGSATPTTPVSGGKAKDMSKNLLGSARKIRARLQPALVKESRSNDRNNYMRLLFLDQTLEGMIKRFEDEFPETRLPSTITSPPLPDTTRSTPEEIDQDPLATSLTSTSFDTERTLVEAPLSEDEDGLHPMLSRHNSDVSLASRALSQEEGRMHRFGQQFRRDILKPDMEQRELTPKEKPIHLQLLRAMVEELGGEELKNKLLVGGEELLMKEISDEASYLRQQLKEMDPEGWEKFAESQEKAIRNQRLEGLERNVSAIE